MDVMQFLLLDDSMLIWPNCFVVAGNEALFEIVVMLHFGVMERIVAPVKCFLKILSFLSY